MRSLFALTLFLSAVLLFAVQPLVAKLLVPLLGGAPAVWNTCMLVFQAALLGGYAYAHAATAWLGARRQAGLHLLIVLLAFLQLPIPFSGGFDRGPPSPADPTGWLIGVLLGTIGLPIFAVATTAPLLQRWFADTAHPQARDPYFLYAASNAGSLLALLAYPLVLAPNVRLSVQCQAWATGYALLALLILACALALWRSNPPPAEPSGPACDRGAPGLSAWTSWIVLSAIPASLLLGVTTYLTTDMAAVPLLWVIPLSLYVLSFIVVFGRRRLVAHERVIRALPLLLMVLAPAVGFGLVKMFWIPAHLATFFVAALVCHGELVRSRPAARHLTAFYLAIAVGGVLGGMFNALVAPRLFNRVAEYPLALALAGLVGAWGACRHGGACDFRRDPVLPAIVGVLTAFLLRDTAGLADSAAGPFGVMLACGLAALVCWTHRRRPLRFVLLLGAFWLASGVAPGVEGRVVHQERSFFGVHRVTSDDGGRTHRLFHGTTLHGEQRFEPAREHAPLSYFERSGPLGQIFDEIPRNPRSLRVAVAGLGVGSIAAYARPGEMWAFYEIDPAVVRIALNPRYFTFIRDCRSGRPDLFIGDARLSLRDAPAHGYDLLILDVFSSDAIPVHLLTREALRIYRRTLSEEGMLVFHLSNRHFDLDPVVGALARDAGLVCRIRYDVHVSPAETRAGKQPSIWAVLAARQPALGALAADSRWLPPHLSRGEPVWTDDYCDLIRHITLGGDWAKR